MQPRVNSLKAAIQVRQAHIGIWCSLASVFTAEVPIPARWRAVRTR